MFCFPAFVPRTVAFNNAIIIEHDRQGVAFYVCPTGKKTHKRDNRGRFDGPLFIGVL